MNNLLENNLLENKHYLELKADCTKCFGYCCVALYFSASDGFPTNKDAGTPCINLEQNYTCLVHNNLRQLNLKGCIAYDCFGAGQKAAQVTSGGQNWRDHPESVQGMFDGFLKIRQLHEMQWYLIHSLMLQTEDSVKSEISALIAVNEAFTHYEMDELLALNLEDHRNKVNSLLKYTSEQVRANSRSRENSGTKSKMPKPGRTDYFGSDLRAMNLRGADFRGACMIAANLRDVDLTGADFIGADLRDADFSGGNLADSIFLSQGQINTAKGNANTKLPITLTRPSSWD